jgi:hypothetical protein
VQVWGAIDVDPVPRGPGQLTVLGDRLDGIRSALSEAAKAVARPAEEEKPARESEAERGRDSAKAIKASSALAEALTRLDKTLLKLSEPKLAVTVKNEVPQGVRELLAEQAHLIQGGLLPLLQASTSQAGGQVALAQQLEQVLQTLRAIEERLRPTSAPSTSHSEPASVRRTLKGGPARER